MLRTVKRYSLKINRGKWQKLCQIARLYRVEKNTHLRYYAQDCHFCAEKSDRVCRDELVAQGYRPPTHLQARQWKMAVKNAYETTQKNWCALSVAVKPLIAHHKGMWTDGEMHYAYWLASSDKRLATWMAEKAPTPDFEVPSDEQRRVRNYLRRIVRRKRGSRPSAKTSRSFELDADRYAVFEEQSTDHKKHQFIAIMSLVARQRMVIPLTGYAQIGGNLRVVLDFERQRVEIHSGLALEPKPIHPEQGVIALDAGITEVFTDDGGTAYEPSFGETLARISGQLNRTGKARNQAHALQKKSSQGKARRIAKFNLGKKKLRERKRKAQIQIQQHISRAIRQVVQTRSPGLVVTERLDIRGKAKSKGMSRLVNYWMRGSLKERLAFLALAEGFRHQQVNPAYTSQRCPTCGFVHRDNRTGDTFQCLHCGHRDHADRVAATNLLARYQDPDISIDTPKSVVKSILQGRFIDSLEKRANPPLTVSVRTDQDLLAWAERSADPNLTMDRLQNVAFVDVL